jgi:hypothetical protein
MHRSDSPTAKGVNLSKKLNTQKKNFLEVEILQLSDATRIAIGLILLTVPTIQFGGYFLLTQMGKNKVIHTELQRSYYRAGHAHAGVLVLLALITQFVIESTQLNNVLQLSLRVGFAFGFAVS